MVLGALVFLFYLFFALFFSESSCPFYFLATTLFFYLSIFFPHQLLGSILTRLSARAQTSPSRAALCHRDQKQLGHRRTWESLQISGHKSLSIWVSKSVRAPDPPMRLGCEGTEPQGPGRGGAGSPGGSSGVRLPGSPGRALPPVLHPRSRWFPRCLWSWGVPAAQRPRRDQRGSI